MKIVKKTRFSTTPCAMPQYNVCDEDKEFLQETLMHLECKKKN